MATSEQPARPHPSQPARRPGRIRALLTTVCLCSGLLAFLGGLSPATAAPTPPYEPDLQTQGACTPSTSTCQIRFYNAQGIPITGGLTTDLPFAKYVQADQPALSASDIKATVSIATPVSGVPSSMWGNGPLSTSRTYPVAGAPAPLHNNRPTADLGGFGTKTLQSWITNNANPATSGPYQGLYQIRLTTTPSNTPNYYSADILVTGTRWELVYPGPQDTSGTLTVSPASPQQFGTPVTLTDTVTPLNVTGTVQFRDGASNIGTPVAVVSGTASTTTSALSVAGSPHSLTAVFIPGDPVAFNGSTSNTVPYTVTTIPPVPMPGTMVQLAAQISPVTATGSVQFADGISDLGATVTVTAGVASMAQKFDIGAHVLTAKFLPADAALFQPSTGVASLQVSGPAAATPALSVSPANQALT
ncbi:MAG: hypothetical protein NVSMB32_12530 [Actinomycetota bacterium]